MDVHFLPALYLAIALTHFLIQITLAAYYRRQYKPRQLPLALPKVAVIVPGYRENIADVLKTIDSCIKAIDYLPANGPNCQIVYVEDDADNSVVHTLRSIYSSEPKVTITSNGKNLGKREAQGKGYRLLLIQGYRPDFVVTVDSDTELAPDAIYSLISRFRQKTGAVTGNITIATKDNILQKIISLRYFLAFNQERASQSVFGEVLCCSGPLTAYRADLFHRLLPFYLGQSFMGTKCTFGDDRHLTSLVLRAGYQTIYDYQAVCRTNCPSTLWGYITQQKRWSKSFVREGLLMFSQGVIFNGHVGTRWFALWESAVCILLPLLLATNVSILVAHADSFWVVPRYLGIIALVAGLRSLIGIHWDTFNSRRDYVLFPLFALFNFVFLLPLRLNAIATLNDTRWGTR